MIDLEENNLLVPNGLVYNCLVEACGKDLGEEEMITYMHGSRRLKEFEESMKLKCQELAPYWYETRNGLYDTEAGLDPMEHRRGWLEL